MTILTCPAARQAIFEAGEASAAAGAVDHLAQCAACRTWHAEFSAGARTAARDDALTAAVLARTAQGDWRTEAVLLWARDLLPDLAEIDPGPAFTARVLAATGGAPPEAEGWRRRWDALVRRPRFALEAAYVLTIVLMLVAGNPLAAVGPAVARAPLARQISVPVDALDAGIRVVGRRVADVGAVPASDAVVAWPAWLRGARRWVADAVSAWLTRMSDVASSAAGWIQRHFGDPPDETARSS